MPGVIVETKHGGAVSENPLATKIGVDVLEAGGNAVDALVAMSYAITVTLPHLGGIGGDFYGFIRKPNGELFIVNGSGPSPSAIIPRYLESLGYKRVPERGGLSITVPGLVDGTWLLWSREGTLDWRELLTPSIDLAENGFPLPYTLASAVKKYSRELRKYDDTWNLYRGLVEPGATVRFPGLARLLREISLDHRYFYEGDPAERISEAARRWGGVLSPKDMAGYRAYIVEPLEMIYHGWRILEMPPNTQGVTTLFILKLLEDGKSPHNIRRLVEVYEKAYNVRDNYVGDPRYMTYTPSQLLSQEFIDKLASEATRLEPCGGSDTTFLAAVDAHGMIALGIQSLFHHFGSMVTEPYYQVTLHSRASCFTLKKGVPNTLGPNKLPLHTLSTVFLERSGETVGYGLSAGHYRPQFHSQIAEKIARLNKDPVEAFNSPRLAWVPWTNKLIVEPGHLEGTGFDGYIVEEAKNGVGGVVHYRNGTARIASDVRGEGLAMAVRR
jgi:gamma-glutamyltranspeptidase/glutathione hydrolase